MLDNLGDAENITDFTFRDLKKYHNFEISKISDTIQHNFLKSIYYIIVKCM